MYKHIFKRLFDILGSIILIPFVLIFLIIIFTCFLVVDRGPLIYKSKRLGKNLRTFTMYKIRTMKVNAPDIRNEDGSTFNSDNDPRVTKLGKILRKTSLDELPQIFNVLVGNMSFVGPRPDLSSQKDYYTKKDKTKFNVRPGITGYAQVNGRNDISWDEKNILDSSYVKKMTLWLDIKIIFKTLVNVTLRKGVNRKEK